MDESELRQFSMDRRLTFKVDFNIPTPFQRENSLAENAREWCAANIKAEWRADHSPTPVFEVDEIFDLDDLTKPPVPMSRYTGRYHIIFHFERQEDAALFRMFWSEGA